MYKQGLVNRIDKLLKDNENILKQFKHNKLYSLLLINIEKMKILFTNMVVNNQYSNVIINESINRYRISISYLDEIYLENKNQGNFIILGSINKMINNLKEMIDSLEKLK